VQKRTLRLTPLPNSGQELREEERKNARQNQTQIKRKKEKGRTEALAEARKKTVPGRIDDQNGRPPRSGTREKRIPSNIDKDPSQGSQRKEEKGGGRSLHVSHGALVEGKGSKRTPLKIVSCKGRLPLRSR